MPTPIDITKVKQTCAGYPYRNYSSDGPAHAMYHGAVFVGGMWQPCTHSKYGAFSLGSHEGQYDLVMEPDASQLKVDDKIMVRDRDTDGWAKRHFAKLSSDGSVMTFVDGTTSWTVDYDEAVVEEVYTTWDEWRLPTEEELK